MAPPPPPARPILKWIRSRFVERTLRRLPRTDAVLDLGCGWGFYFLINPHAHGVDADPRCVESLRARGFRVERADVLEGLPFADERFQYVIAHDVLEHFVFSELERLVAEVARVLRPGGCFLVFVPNRKGYEVGVQRGYGHRLFVTEAEIARLCVGRFELRQRYPEPLPRWLGRFFTHNKEVFVLVKPDRGSGVRRSRRDVP